MGTETTTAQMMEIIQQFKTLKLVENMYNNICMGGLVPLILLQLFMVSTLSLYSCVMLHDLLSLPMLVMIALLGLDTMVSAQVIMYDTAGNVNFVSQNLLNRCKQDVRFRRTKIIWRSLKSICPLKVKIGTSGSYMEKITPLNITQMTVDQVTSMILLTKN